VAKLNRNVIATEIPPDPVDLFPKKIKNNSYKVLYK
jgi:hypothetical protein